MKKPQVAKGAVLKCCTMPRACVIVFFMKSSFFSQVLVPNYHSLHTSNTITHSLGILQWSGQLPQSSHMKTVLSPQHTNPCSCLCRIPCSAVQDWWRYSFGWTWEHPNWGFEDSQAIGILLLQRLQHEDLDDDKPLSDNESPITRAIAQI